MAAAPYRNISVNGTSTPVGGCQFKLNAGDTVAFTWTALRSLPVITGRGTDVPRPV